MNFTKVDQDPNGCWIACISSITGIPLADLPKASWDNPDKIIRYKNWTLYHNLVMRRLGELGWTVVYLGPKIPRSGYALGSGQSPRHPDDPERQHTVVILDGKPHWDPHLSRAFVPKFEDYEMLVQIEPYIHTESW